MSLRRSFALVLALGAGSVTLAEAQAPAAVASQAPGCCAKAEAPKQMMDCPMMRHDDGSRAAEARLDSLVTVMHQSKGEKKVAVMEKVLDELLAQRSAMHQHMMEMMKQHQGDAPAPEHRH